VAAGATVRTQALLSKLRLARQAAGMTQGQAAAALGCSQGKINKIETGVTKIKQGDLGKLLRIYDLPEHERAAILALTPIGGPMEPGRAKLSPALMRLIDFEPDAVEILALHSERVPRVLQSEHYMLTQFRCAGDAQDNTDVLLAREERAKIFTQASPPRYRAVLTVSSLERHPGGRTPHKVIDQARHLLDLGTSHPNVQIQILTYEANIPHLDADFVVLRFAGERSDFVYYEYGRKQVTQESAQCVAEQVEYWEQLHHEALSVEDSRTFLTDLLRREETRLQKSHHE
jgi:transcriptional regulator with XRE-family HTH domain